MLCKAPLLLPAMGLELYVDLLSQPCRAVYIFAKKNGIPFQLHTVELLKGQHMTQEFSNISVLQKVPVLKDGDFVLTESAILIYLSSKYKVADHWYPADPQTRARVHEYLGWHSDNIRGTFGVLLWALVVGPLMGARVPDEKVERNEAQMNQALQWLQDKFLGDKAFLTGQQVTLADLMALEELMQPAAVGFDLFKRHPRLAAWRGRVEAFVGAELWQEAHGDILTIQDKAGKKALPVPAPEVKQRLLVRLTKIP
uniref:glutathione S-transferase theta-2-like isoform X2 n=1 Tax=Jaculus jaculus TaxID=51337 RepID=UPI001E1B471E|nr:glutathione S-transferase theta-2-like isoform X2 [Jaculus jaculus]